MGFRPLCLKQHWIVGAVFLIHGCGSDDSLSVTDHQVAQQVTSWQVMAASVEQVYRVPGNVTADDRIQLSSRITGFIQQIAVREGDRVARGDLLVEIESAEVTGAIRTAKAALNAAETDLEDARRDVAKFAELAQQGSLPADTLRKAQVRFDLASSQLVEASSASETAVSNLRYTSIRSPVGGVVISLNKRVGDLATTGAPFY
ncbi:MAG: efflux RND transporter periplasmic adaptor subunit [Immundisolibacteraceae bacterium]|nr:efflux RND transporter periplasmic adaptor subunit [Immundisolibacteraceae bacterium]